MVEETTLTAAASTSGSGDFWIGLIALVVVAGIIVAWIAYNRTKTRKKYWSGKVADKKQSTTVDDDGDRSTSYELIIAMDGAARPQKVGVNAAVFNAFDIGDRIEKKLGEMHPSKMSDGLPSV